jgi:hypothetical protein
MARLFYVGMGYVLFGIISSLWWFYHRPTLSYPVIVTANLLPGITLLVLALILSRVPHSPGKRFLMVVAIGLGAFLQHNSG